MDLAVSTRWNAFRHSSGEAMIGEIAALGVRHAELGFDLTLDLVPGVKKMLRDGAIVVDSVHNFCPVPAIAPFAHPELFTLASTDRRVHESAINHTSSTIEFAADVGARIVVLHLGNVEMRGLTARLLKLCAKNARNTPRHERIRLKLLTRRDEKVGRHIEQVYRGLERLLPLLEKLRMRLGIEIPPQWEGVPTESEVEMIVRHFGGDRLSYWHDMGHIQIRENLGFTNHLRTAQRLLPLMSGVHIHDVAPPAMDHLPPSKGSIDFSHFRFLANRDNLLVIEPGPGTPAPDIEAGIRYLREAWAAPSPAEQSPKTGGE